MKGDLPGRSADWRRRPTELKEQLAALERAMRTAFTQRDNADGEIIALREKVEKYKAQQFKVRNNREYDALTREMEMPADTIVRLEKEMEMLEGKATDARSEIETSQGGLIEELDKALAEKRSALAEVSKTTERGEGKFRHERQKIVHRIPKADLATYERIRKAKKGKAIVPVAAGRLRGVLHPRSSPEDPGTEAEQQDLSLRTLRPHHRFGRDRRGEDLRVHDPPRVHRWGLAGEPGRERESAYSSRTRNR